MSMMRAGFFRGKPPTANPPMDLVSRRNERCGMNIAGQIISNATLFYKLLQTCCDKFLLAFGKGE